MSSLYTPTRSHFLVHHNTATTPGNTPKAGVFSSQIIQSPIYRPSGLISPAHIMQSRQLFPQSQGVIRNNTSVIQRQPSCIIGYLKNNFGQRQCDFKMVEDESIRIKDTVSGCCYKFKVSSNAPIIKKQIINSNISLSELTLFLIFQKEYINDLQKFLNSIYSTQSLKNYNHITPTISLQFRFLSIEQKNKLTVLIESLKNNLQTSVNLNKTTSTIHQRNNLQNYKNITYNELDKINTIKSNNPQYKLTQSIKTTTQQQIKDSIPHNEVEFKKINEQNIMKIEIQKLQDRLFESERRNEAYRMEINSLKKQVSEFKSMRQETRDSITIENLINEINDLQKKRYIDERYTKELINQLLIERTNIAILQQQKVSLINNHKKQIEQLLNKPVINSPIINLNSIQSIKKQLQQQIMFNSLLESQNQKLALAKKQCLQIIQQKNTQITSLQVEFTRVEPTPSPKTKPLPSFPVQHFSLEEQRKKISQQYQILISRQKQKQLTEMQDKIKQLEDQNKLKHQIIQQLQNELNKTIHNCNIVKLKNDKNDKNDNKQIQKIKSCYEQEINKLKQTHENQLANLDAQGIRTRSRTKSQANQLPNSITKTFDETDKTKLKGCIEKLEHERQNLILMLEKHKSQDRKYNAQKQPTPLNQSNQDLHQQHQISYTKYKHGSNPEGQQGEVIERLTYKVDQDTSMIQKVIYKTSNHFQRFVETEVIERITTDATTGQQHAQSIQRVVEQLNQGYDKKQVTTYELDDGQQKFIQKTTIKSVDGKKVEQIDTNILVRQQQGELVYDIETQQTKFGQKGQVLNYNPIQPKASYLQIETNQITEDNKMLFQGDNINVVNEDSNIVIHGGDYDINIPNLDSQKITITEQTYQRVEDSLFRND